MQYKPKVSTAAGLYNYNYHNFEKEYCNFDGIKQTSKYFGDFVVEKSERCNFVIQKLKEISRTFGGTMTKLEVDNCFDIWNLNQSDRWRLYRFWVARFVEPLTEALNRSCTEYDAQQKILDEIVQEENYSVIKKLINYWNDHVRSCETQAVIATC